MPFQFTVLYIQEGIISLHLILNLAFPCWKHDSSFMASKRMWLCHWDVKGFLRVTECRYFNVNIGPHKMFLIVFGSYRLDRMLDTKRRQYILELSDKIFVAVNKDMWMIFNRQVREIRAFNHLDKKIYCFQLQAKRWERMSWRNAGNQTMQHCIPDDSNCNPVKYLFSCEVQKVSKIMTGLFLVCVKNAVQGTHIWYVCASAR
jgi:hypothetical protein